MNDKVEREEVALPSHGRVVIIGGGIAGVGTAYHLAQKGWKDIVLVDQGSLFNSGGSSSHAPGGISLIDQRSELVSGFGQVSAELYEKVGTLQRVGTLALIRSNADKDAILAEQQFCHKIGLRDVRIVSPEEVSRLWPQMDTSKIVGALYYPPSMRVAPGRVSAVRTITELAKLTSRLGAASFHQHTRVERIVTKEDKVVGVETSRGFIATEHVVIAAGVWGPLIARTAGVELPIAHVQHQWTLTQPIDKFSKYTFPLNTDGPGHQDLPSALPCIWDPKSATYTYQMGSCLGIGNYNHKALVVDADDIAKLEHRGPSGPAEMPFTPEHFEVARQDVETLIPSLKGVALRKAFNGLMSYAPDGFPLIGPVRNKTGLWVIECTYVWHAGGASKLLSEWMDAGKSPSGVDVSSVDVDRFKGRRFSVEELRAGAAATYESRMTDHRQSHVSQPHSAKL